MPLLCALLLLCASWKSRAAIWPNDGQDAVNTENGPFFSDCSDTGPTVVALTCNAGKVGPLTLESFDCRLCGAGQCWRSGGTFAAEGGYASSTYVGGASNKHAMTVARPSLVDFESARCVSGKLLRGRMICATTAVAGVTGCWCDLTCPYDIAAVLNAEVAASSTGNTPLAAFDWAGGLLVLALMLVTSFSRWNTKPRSVAAKMSTNIKAASFAEQCWRAPLLYVLLSLHLLLGTAAATPFADKAELKVAVDQWIASPTAAETANGHISDWDTSKVTDM